MEQDWDAIIVGSGIGGLAAANVLARVGGRRVLVLERHSQAGGLTQVFRRGGASWDVGVHYVGNVAPGAQTRQLMDAFSDGRLRWNKLPHRFERFVYPGRDFRVPADPHEYRAALIREFPHQKAAIRGYFRDLRATELWATAEIAQRMMPDPVAAAIRFCLRATGGVPTSTTAEAVARRVRSPELRALLTSQWADYGLPPVISSFAMHALVVGSFRHGAWFPAGGAGQIARSFEPGIEAAGGGVLVSHEVTEILVEDGRAVGVQAVDRRGPVPVERELRAPVIISDVGAEATYNRLLPVTGPIGQATQAVREALAALHPGVSAVTLYLRLSQPVATLGVQGENLRLNTQLDHGDLRAEGEAVLAGRPRFAYCSFPSAKSGDDRYHTAEIIAIVPADAFDPWSDCPDHARSPAHARSPDYEAVKERVANGLVRLAERTLPGLTGLIDYWELSSPLTVENYTGHAQGRFFGVAAVPGRHRPGLITVRTPVPGLLLAGTDASSPGIVGALMGGVGAGTQALGPGGYPLLQRYLRRRPSGDDTTEREQSTPGARVGNPRRRPSGDDTTEREQPTPGARVGNPRRRPSGDGTPGVPAEGAPNALIGRHRCVLEGRSMVSPTVRRLDFQLDEPWDFRPGQYLRLRVAPLRWRDYSVIAAGDRSLSLLVSTRTGGDGSHFADQAPLGTETAIEGPFGAFHLRPGRRHRVFVATGTGLAPLLGMFAQLRETGELAEAELYFGCPNEEEDLTSAFDVVPPATTTCFSRSPVPAGPDALAGPSSLSGDAPDDPTPTPPLAVAGDAPRRDHPAGAPGPRRVVAGRVTAALADAHLDAAASDFYVCGSAAMVRDVTKLLRARGATEVLTEPF